MPPLAQVGAIVEVDVLVVAVVEVELLVLVELVLEDVDVLELVLVDVVVGQLAGTGASLLWKVFASLPSLTIVPPKSEQ